jgi:hypothetical protein
MIQEQKNSFIVGKKLTAQYEINKEMERELSIVFDNLNARLSHEVIERFTNEMIANRMKDVVIEEDTINKTTRFKLELFVFNRQELEALLINDMAETLLKK